MRDSVRSGSRRRHRDRERERRSRDSPKRRRSRRSGRVNVASKSRRKHSDDSDSLSPDRSRRRSESRKRSHGRSERRRSRSRSHSRSRSRSRSRGRSVSKRRKPDVLPDDLDLLDGVGESVRVSQGGNLGHHNGSHTVHDDEASALFLLIHTKECGKLIGQKAQGLSCLTYNMFQAIKKRERRANVIETKITIQAQPHKDRNAKTEERYLRIDGIPAQYHDIAISQVLILVEKCRDYDGNILTRERSCVAGSEDKIIELIIGNSDCGALIKNGVDDAIAELLKRLEKDIELSPSMVRVLFHDYTGHLQPNNAYRRMKIYGIPAIYRKTVIDFMKPRTNFLHCLIEGWIQGKVGQQDVDRTEQARIEKMEAEVEEQRQRAAEAILATPQYARDSCQIPAGAVGAVIGPKGCIVAEICRQGGLKINIDQSTTPSTGQATVMITGEQRNIPWAKTQIQELVSRWKWQAQQMGTPAPAGIPGIPPAPGAVPSPTTAPPIGTSSVPPLGSTPGPSPQRPPVSPPGPPVPQGLPAPLGQGTPPTLSSLPPFPASGLPPAAIGGFPGSALPPVPQGEPPSPMPSVPGMPGMPMPGMPMPGMPGVAGMPGMPMPPVPGMPMPGMPVPPIAGMPGMPMPGMPGMPMPGMPGMPMPGMPPMPPMHPGMFGAMAPPASAPPTAPGTTPGPPPATVAKPGAPVPKGKGKGGKAPALPNIYDTSPPPVGTAPGMSMMPMGMPMMSMMPGMSAPPGLQPLTKKKDPKLKEEDRERLKEIVDYSDL